MRIIAPGRSQTVFGAFCVAQLLAPLASSALFQAVYHYQPRIILYHFLIVTVVYLALLGIVVLPCMTHLVRARRVARYALPLVWGICSVTLYLSYLLAWGGRMYMGVNISPGLLTPYLVRPASILDSFPPSMLLLFAGMIALGGAILFAYLVCAKSFAAALLRWRTRLLQSKRTQMPRTRQLAIMGGILALMAALFVAFCEWPPTLLQSTALFGDPILISLRGQVTDLPFAPLDTSADVAQRAYAPPAQFRRKNVILIVVDACRADHLSLFGYERDTTPFLNSLQRSGHLRVVRSFYSASCCTFGGVLSLLRSQHWFKMQARAFGLQDVLKRSGYRVHFVLGGDLTNFNNLDQYFGHNLDTLSDGYDPTRRASLNDDRGVFETLDRVASYDGTPAFLYLHLMSVHPMGLRQGSSARYLPASSSFFKPNPVQYGNSYDNGVIQADGYIRELFERLQEKGYLQNSLVVITGDHGESVGERGYYGHAHNLYAEEVQPPLLIYDTDPVEYRNLEFARQIDVAPTILDRLGLPIPPSWDGRSLLSCGPERFAYLRISDTFAVIDHTPERTLKYIYDDRVKKEEVFNESVDPKDGRNVIRSTDAQELQTLRKAVGAFAVHPGS